MTLGSRPSSALIAGIVTWGTPFASLGLSPLLVNKEAGLLRCLLPD